MGVHGLWQLINSTGKPVPLESLEGKVLAVDVSVWLHQLSKGMRDSQGNPLANAHLHGLFTRICKLLYYRIKPVFVFDGGVPELKKQTLASRRDKRDDAEKSSSQMQQKILTNLLRSQVLRDAYGVESAPNLPSTAKSSSAKGSNKDAIFQLPPLPEASKVYLSQDSSEDATISDRLELQQMVEDQFESIEDIDVDSGDFRSLPPEIQHEVITDIRLRRKNYNLSKIVELPEESKDFSQFQMAKLVKHNRLNTRLDQLRKDLNTRQTRSLTKQYGASFGEMDDVYSQRLVSEDSAHYILAKRNLKQKKENEQRKKIKSKLDTNTVGYSETTEHVKGFVDKFVESEDEERSSLDDVSDSGIDWDLSNSKKQKLNPPGNKKRSGNSNSSDNAYPTRSVNITCENNEKMRSVSVRENIGVDKPTSGMISGDVIGGDKPRFRPVIEIESGSESESDVSGDNIDREIDSDSSSRQRVRLNSGQTDNDVIIVEECLDHDEALQMAIAESLKEQTYRKNDTTLSRDIVSTTGQSTGSALQVKTGLSQNCSNDVDTETMNYEPDWKLNKADNKSDNQSTANAFDSSGIIKSLKNEQKIIKKSMDIFNTTNSQGIVDKSRTNPTVKSRGEKSRIFKRKVSCLSEDGREGDGKNRKKVKVIVSSDEEVGMSEGEEESSVVKEAETCTSSDSEDDFIEVRVDPAAICEDAMFPASMFDSCPGPDADKEKSPEPPSKQLRLQASEGPLPVQVLGKSSSDRGDPDTVEKHHSPLTKSIATSHQHDSVFSPARKEHAYEHVDTKTGDSLFETERISLDTNEIGEQVSKHFINQQSSASVTSQLTSQANKMSPDRSLATEIMVAEGSKESQNSLTGSVNEADDILDESEADDNELSQNSPLMPDIVESTGRQDNERIPDLVKQFESLNENSVRALSNTISQETRQLRREQGRQERLAVSITDQMHADAQELLQLFGIPYLVSPTEAEAQCAYLEMANLTQGTITEDSDIWLFGGKCVFKNFFNQQKHVECYRDVHITSQLGLMRDSLIQLALLCGSDYTEGIRGVGPVIAMEILAEFPGHSLDGLVKLKSWWDEAQKQIKIPSNESKLQAKLRDLHIRDGFPSQVVVDAYLSPTVDESTEKFSWGLPDLNQLRKFAGDRLGWDQKKTDENLLPVLKRLAEKRTQRSIQAFFQPEIYMQPAKVKSKRLQNVVCKIKNPDQQTAGGDSNTDIKPQGTESQPDTGKNKGKGKARKSGPRSNAKNAKCEDKVDIKENPVDIELDCLKEESENKASGKTNKHNKTREQSGKEIEKQSKEISKQSLSKQKNNVPHRNQSSSSCYSDSSSDSESSVELFEYSSDDEVPVINTGLNVEEILGLKMNSDDRKTAEKAEICSDKYKERVFENSVNVSEILNLDSGSFDAASADDVEVDNADKNTKIGQDDSENMEVKSETEVDYSHEGGFIRDEEDDDSNVPSTDNKFKQKTKKSVTFKLEPKNEDEAVFSKADSDVDKGNLTVEPHVKNNPKSTESFKQGDSDIKLMTEEGKKVTTKKTVPSLNQNVVEDENSKKTDSKCDTELTRRTSRRKVKPSIYAEDPLKPEVKGVPWASRGRGRRKTGASKGPGKNIVPTETVVKRANTNITAKRNLMDGPNLSESDSD